MTPQPQAGTETAETSEKLLNTYFMKVVGYCNAQDYDTMDACEAVEAEILSHIAAQAAALSAQAAAISELVEGLSKQVAKCRRCSGDGTELFTGKGAGIAVGPCSGCEKARALIAKHDGAYPVKS